MSFNTNSPSRSGNTGSSRPSRFSRSSGSKTQTDRKRPFGHESDRELRRPEYGQRPMRGGPRQGGRGNMTMKPDFNLFVKKAKPVTIEEYTPTSTFAEHGLHETLVTSLGDKGYTQPTPIQDKAIPHLLAGRDLIGIANTGTGKTAAFLLPLIHKALSNKDKKVLILAPTRELALQIEQELKSLTKNSNILSTIITGGVPQGKQIDSLRKHRHFVVGTTGRIMDLAGQRKLNLSEFDTIVLDEMDQMLDMGFLKDIHKILQQTKQDKHLLFFSATMDKNIEQVAFTLLTDPVSVSVVQGTTTDNVEQDVVMYGVNDDRLKMLFDMLNKPEVTKALVFENTKHGVKKMEKILLDKGLNVVAIHGNKNQNQRQKALDLFKSGKVNILLATNVAARGLDIPQVSHVFNFSLPQSREDYIHRIGRTGRAGKTGFAFTFVPKSER